MSEAERVAVVGAGIVGLAYAWSAAERGHRVCLVERSSHACGASVRNFGMVWPVGQPFGPLRETALCSRERWLTLHAAGAVVADPCGSIHLAHRTDEWEVLTEYASLAREHHDDCELLNAEQVQRRSAFVRSDGLIGGLFSPT
ncbi:MAG: FAD-dependent oxidoreductase, partial [Planctomycetaceae bacterium]|nr:FAD-dependent oxidoreductase [Planctomycetaceae bacterium]